MIQKIEISSKTIVFTVFFLLLLNIIWISREVIYALFLAFIFMSALKRAVSFLVRFKVPRLLAVFMVFITTLLSLIFLLAYILPPLVVESVSFIKTLPAIMTSALPFLSDYFKVETLTNYFTDIPQNFIRVVSSVFSNIIFVVSTLFFTLYFLIEEKFLKNFLDKFLNEKESAQIINIVDKVERRMGAWVWGEVILMTVIGAATYIGLYFLNVKYILPLAVLAGFLEVVPMIGPIISAVPAFFVAMSSSFVLGLSVALLYIIIQQLENNLIVPLVMRKAVGINPIITLIALTVGGKIGGFFGVLLSVPVVLFIETVLIELSKIRK